MNDRLSQYISRDTLINLGLLIVSFIFMFVIIEGYLIFGMGVSPGSYPEVTSCSYPGEELSEVNQQYTFHPNYGWIGVSDGVFVRQETMFEDRDRYTHNSEGFRDTYNSGDNSIIVLGDSYTYGWLADDNSTYPYLLDKWSQNTSFYNYGQGGYGTAQELLVYRNVSNTVNHDLVIIGYVANDPRDNAGVGPNGEEMPRRPIFELSNGSTKLVHTPEKLESMGSNEDNDEISISRQMYNTIDDYSATFTYLRPVVGRVLSGNSGSPTPPNVSREDSQYRHELTGELLNRTASEAARHNAEVLIVTLPPKAVFNQQNTSYSEYRRNEWGQQKTMVRSVSAQRGNVHYLETEPAIRRSITDGTNLYGKRDGHPNEVGYRVIAENINQWLRENGYVSSRPNPSTWDNRGEVSSCP